MSVTIPKSGCPAPASVRAADERVARSLDLTCSRRSALTFLALAGLAPMLGTSLAPAATLADETQVTRSTGLTLDASAWNYDADHDVYWQIGLTYCAAPAAPAYESLGIYVPGAYLTGTANADGATYTCAVNAQGSCGGHTAADAPVVLPVNTAGYSAQAAPTSYDYQGVADYLAAGFVYVYAGCRGRANGDGFAGGAPWGVTDLKAAVRYLRANADLIPGDMDAIFTFGHSGGGAQSALMGASGDSELYAPYLASIGAVGTGEGAAAVSDAVAGSMCWCPITCLDVADEAYEWMMGQYATEGTRADGTFTAQLSDDLAAAFAARVNELGLVGEDGGALSLEQSAEGVWAQGTYYDRVLAAVEASLNNFLADTSFPYTPSSQTMADGGFGGAGGGMGGAPGGEAPSGGTPGGEPPADAGTGGAPTDGGVPSDSPSGAPADGGAPAASGSFAADGSGTAAPDGLAPATTGGPAATGTSADAPAADGSSEQVTYATAADYVAALNADDPWIDYDEAANTARVLSLASFVRACKPATKDVCAFDALGRSQAENDLFGTAAQDSAHFDATLARLLADNADAYEQLGGWDGSYPDAYAADLALTDDLGVGMATRADMYNPLYYLLDAYGGRGSSTVASHWRVHSGIEQGDTSLTTELNLALALRADERVSDVEFAAVWGQGHTTAERTGDAATNFIAWVNACLA